ncbi:unnamed protein product [Cunninghamella echinulata]
MDSIKFISFLAIAEPPSNKEDKTTSFSRWSRTSKDDKTLSTMLQSIELSLLPQCANTDTTTTIQRCMSNGGKGQCVGDEGGPVIYNNQLVGVLS